MGSPLMPNILIPVDRTIQTLLNTLKQASCADKAIELHLNAPNANIWTSVQDFENLLITIARMARYVMGAPDKINIGTWAPREGEPERKIWLKFIAQIDNPSNTQAESHRHITHQAHSEAALVDTLRFQTHIDTMPAHLAELVKTPTQFKVVLVFKASTLPFTNRLEDSAF